jgi:hypothetical protein
MADSVANTQTDRHRYTLGPDETPSEAVTTAVADMTNQSRVELPVLNDTIDPGALNRFFDSADGNASSLIVTFDYCGYSVTVTPGEVRVESS